MEITLVGAGGEPVDLWRTLISHGVASLPPSTLDEGRRQLRTTVALNGGARSLVIEGAGPDRARVRLLGGRAKAGEQAAVRRIVEHLLRLDEDLSEFYAKLDGDPDLAWARRGAGRLLRSPSVYEDVVKTICTTNCTWSATERMVGALVEHLGAPGSDGRAFPSARAMADVGEDFYRDVARAGYRGAYLRSIAAAVADGTLDLEELRGGTDVPDDVVAARLLALPGVGPYAAAHVMMLLGRYSRLVLDAWTRPKYARLVGRKSVADRTIERRFRRYGPYAGLAFWLFLTRDWVESA